LAALLPYCHICSPKSPCAKSSHIDALAKFLLEYKGILHNLGDRLRYVKKQRDHLAVNIQQRIDAILVRNSKLKALTLFEARKQIAKTKESVKKATPVIQKARCKKETYATSQHSLCQAN